MLFYVSAVPRLCLQLKFGNDLIPLHPAPIGHPSQCSKFSKFFPSPIYHHITRSWTCFLLSDHSNRTLESTNTMAPSAINTSDAASAPDATVLALRKTLVSETEPLARRFRALFSLKHLACQESSTPQTLQAIDAIAAGFSSASALLKHELAYCLGQSRNPHSVSYLNHVLEDKHEDAMCRHEAAEALGALGYEESLELLRRLRDAPDELDVITETCDIAVARIEWEHSKERQAEKIRQRYSGVTS